VCRTTRERQEGPPTGLSTRQRSGGASSATARVAWPGYPTPMRSSSRRLPTTTRRPSTRATAPWPGTFSKPCARSGAGRACRRTGRWPRRGVLRLAFDGGDQQFVAVHVVVGGDEVGDRRLALGQGGGLVHHDDLDVCGGLQRDRVLEQHPALGAQPGTDHDRGRGGQPSASGRVTTTTVIANRMGMRGRYMTSYTSHPGALVLLRCYSPCLPADGVDDARIGQTRPPQRCVREATRSARDGSVDCHRTKVGLRDDRARHCLRCAATQGLAEELTCEMAAAFG
jgi:hypothetical protein